MELLILLAIILLFLGYKRLPEVGRSMGRGVREFKGELASKEAPEKRHSQAAEEEEEEGEKRPLEQSRPSRALRRALKKCREQPAQRVTTESPLGKAPAAPTQEAPHLAEVARGAGKLL
jgi:sec-independent protein translocase protein TatA